MAVADLADAAEIVGWRDDDAARPLHRFCDEGGDGVGALRENRRLEPIRRGLAERLARIVAHEAIRIWRVDVDEPRRPRLEHRPERREAGRAHRGERESVISAEPRDHLDLVRLADGLPVEARRLE